MTARPTGYATQIDVDVQRREGWEQWFMMMADIHWDNPHCDRRLLKHHLDQAKERGADIMIFGDLFCLMQGRYDPRRARDDIRPEHNVANYLQAVVDDWAAWWEPYAERTRFISYGNHETAILQHAEFDAIQQAAAVMRANTGASIELGDYDGWIQWRCVDRSSVGDKGNGAKIYRQCITAYYTHGSGGGGEVTKGVIKTARRNAWVDGADIVISGHIHEDWQLKTMTEMVLSNGRIVCRPRVHVQLPTYKKEHEDRRGYHRKNERPPKPLGAKWLRLFWHRENDNIRRVCIEVRDVL